VRRRVYAGLAAAGSALVVLVGLGIAYRHRWSWLVIPTWITVGATLGLFVGAVVTALYAQKTFASQAEQLREQREFNRKQTEFNERQLEISQTSSCSPSRPNAASAPRGSGLTC
jgi:hypothetical protein